MSGAPGSPGPATPVEWLGGYQEADEQSAGQRRFKRLVGEVQAHRVALVQWQEALPAARAEAAVLLAPLRVSLQQAQRELLLVIDVLLSAPRKQIPQLNRRRHEALNAVVVELATELLEDGPDAGVEAIHDRHAPMTRAEQAALEADMARRLFGGLLDDEQAGGDEPSAEEVYRSVQRKLDEQAAAQQARAEKRDAKRAERRKAKGKGPTRNEQQAAALAEARQQAGQSVREIYRKLASSLHPDRATDEPDRLRRTALMQRANQAYAGGDLLELLNLQVELEQIGSADIARLPEERVLHYNMVLEEQLAVIRRETAELLRPLAQGGRVPREPADLKALIAEDAATLRNQVAQLEAERQWLADPVQRIALIDRWRSRLELGAGQEEEAALLQAMLAERVPRRGGRRR